jgi:hypothetical protein
VRAAPSASHGRCARRRARRVVVVAALAAGCDSRAAPVVSQASVSDASSPEGGGSDASPDGCVGGATCHPGGNPCLTAEISCKTMGPVCAGMTKVPEGTPCGSDQVCADGECVSCVSGIACTPAGSVCKTGTLSCSTGSSTCRAVGNASNGTVCGANRMCVDGECVGCVEGAACVPAGTMCKTGAVSCGTGDAACVATGDVSDLTTCEAGICCGGVCSACNAPTNATASCSATACTFACNAGYTLCAGSCVDATSDGEACGPLCAICPPGSKCNDSQCAAVFSYGNSVAYSPCAQNGVFEGGYLLGELVYIATDIQVTALGVIASPAQPGSGVHGIMALYSNLGDSPSVLMANTATTTILPGNNLIPVTSTASVPAGDYWIMAEYDVNASICSDEAGSNPIAFVPVDYGSVPSTITDPTIEGTVDFNYYILGI